MGLCQVISVQRQKNRQTVLLGWEKNKKQKRTTPRLLKSDVSFVFTASSLITEPVVQTRALLLWQLLCFFHSNLWGHSVLRAELCSRGEQIRENIQGATVIWSDTNTSFFSQPWKLRGFLQFSPLWWLCAPPLCVWCLPSAGHPRRCAPTPTRGPSSWQDRRSTPLLCCCSPCCPQVIMHGCVSPFLLTTKLFFSNIICWLITGSLAHLTVMQHPQLARVWDCISLYQWCPTSGHAGARIQWFTSIRVTE